MARSPAPASASRDDAERGPKAPASQGRPAEDAAALASYIADMASELSRLAGGAHMPMVSYFLNLARVEAETHARKLGGFPIEREE